jgi:hypothetical protein
MLTEPLGAVVSVGVGVGVGVGEGVGVGALCTITSLGALAVPVWSAE